MPDSAETIAAVRRFSRFYTRRIGLLQDGLLGGPLTLPEARLVYEVAQHGPDDPPPTARAIGAALDLDPGYLSRLLRSLEERGLVARRPSPADGRQMLLALTEAGQARWREIDDRSRQAVGAMLAGLSDPERRRLVAALREVEALLGPSGVAPAPVVLRPARIGDHGWVVQRHGVLYAREFGWDASFEGMVAEVVAGFLRDHDPAREGGWIVERGGDPLGSVYLMRGPEEAVAKLRLLCVEPEARGLGLGRLLVAEALRFARAARYRRVSLWTNSILVAARALYQDLGFRLVEEAPHRSFGHDLVGETWVLDL